MKKVHISAMGKQIDMDNIRLANEDTIAIGNMKVNARGDELGFSGQVVKTRNQVMDEYYRLNTPSAREPLDTLDEDDWGTPTTKEISTPMASESTKSDAKPLIQSPKKSN